MPTFLQNTTNTVNTAATAIQNAQQNQSVNAASEEREHGPFYRMLMSTLLNADPARLTDENLLTVVQQADQQQGQNVSDEEAELYGGIIQEFYNRQQISLQPFELEQLRTYLPLFERYRPHDAPLVRRLIQFSLQPPILWGLNETANRFYASVIWPNIIKADLLLYIFGREDYPYTLKDENGEVLPEQMMHGQTITFSEDSETSVVSLKHRRDGLETGSVMRAGSYPESSSAAGEYYTLPMEDGEMQLNEEQFRALQMGWITWLQRKAKHAFSMAKIYLETQTDHVEGSNSLIRGISDWRGDVDLPSYSNYLNPMQEATSILIALNLLDHTEPVLTNAQTVSSLFRRFADVARDVQQARYEWDVYITGTISGADAMVATLETVRNVSFAVAAGLAGAAVAPAAFAAVVAGKGTAVATGAAIVAGAGTGGVTKAGLEFTGAAAGEGLAMAITPGDQEFNTDYVLDRTASGAKSGLIDGGMGAASFFQGAFVASRFSPAFAASRTGQVTIGAISGGSSELALATGEELLFSGAEGPSGWNILKRAGIGTFLGGATSLVPIDGLYRTRPNGGISFTPMRGQPVTPEWMLASPWSFVQPRGRADVDSSLTPRGSQNYEAINSLPADQLPVLPEGYSWARVNGNEWGIVRPPNMPDIDVHVWLAPEGGYNFAVRQAGAEGTPSAMLQSNARARRSSNNRARNERETPYDSGDYHDAGDPHTSYDQGHGIDHADTHRPVTGPDNTSDPANFSPQNSGWNRQERRILVSRVRNGRNPRTGQGDLDLGTSPQYKEVSYYGPNPRRTANGEPVPDGVFFIVADSAGVPQMAFRVPRTYNRMTGRGSVNRNLETLEVPLTDLPTAALRGGQFLPFGGVMGSSASSGADQ